ncbi:ATP-binding cassette domain-containing protein [Streptococcus ferus]|uniref:ATP-binding cassette domain-containing protein n=1 Tax=Streptococcus ferus TaxID=1345 RepID=UPI0035A18A0D
MLQLEKLTITHQKDLQDLVHNLDLVLNPGEKLAIIGEEGTGKSSLIKAIVAPQLLSSYAQLSGKITNHFHQFGYLPQALENEDLQLSVMDFLYRDLDYGLFDFNLFYKYADQFGLDLEKFEANVQTMTSLSGGEKLKVQLLKILANDPDLLILDEPSSDLDLETLQWLENFIQQSDKAILFISHDESLLSLAATAILHLELLKKRTEPRATFYRGSYDQYRQERKEGFEHQLRVAKKEREEHAKKMERHHRIHQSVEHVLRHTHDSTAGRLLAKKMKNVLSQEKRLKKEAENLTEMPQDMDAIQLFFSEIKPLPASKILLSWEKKALATGQTTSLQIRGQDKLVITGKNGIGKTRLLKLLLQDLQARPDLSVGYMPQHYEEEFENQDTPLSFLASVADEEKARTLLASLKFTRQEVIHALHDLSGGQKAKLFLARMVLAGNDVLLLDEPSRHFSPTSQPLIRQLLIDYPGAIISVSHDRRFIEEVTAIHYQLVEESLLRIR